MSYVARNLTDGEEVIYQTGLHWIVLLGPIIVATMSLCLGILLLFAHGGGVAFVFVAAGAVIFVVGLVNRNATEMAVTSKRVVIKSGLLRRRTIELLIPKVESIDVDQPLFGRMLGYGTIAVRGIGGSKEPFRNVRSPLELRRQVQRLN